MIEFKKRYITIKPIKLTPKTLLINTYEKFKNLTMNMTSM